MWSGRYAPLDGLLRDFIWEPLGELELDIVLAFGRKWVDMAQELGLQEAQR